MLCVSSLKAKATNCSKLSVLVNNPRAAISNLRLDHGVCIYADENFDTKGRRTVKYHIGTPSRKLIAAGYRAMALGIV
jgi:hypothetical protein